MPSSIHLACGRCLSAREDLATDGYRSRDAPPSARAGRRPRGPRRDPAWSWWPHRPVPGSGRRSPAPSSSRRTRRHHDRGRRVAPRARDDPLRLRRRPAPRHLPRHPRPLRLPREGRTPTGSRRSTSCPYRRRRARPRDYSTERRRRRRLARRLPATQDRRPRSHDHRPAHLRDHLPGEGRAQRLRRPRRAGVERGRHGLVRAGARSLGGPSPRLPTSRSVACSSGSFGSNLPCETATVAGDTATFKQSDLAPHQALTVVVAIPKGAVPEPKPILEERFDLAKAFTVNGWTVGGALAGLVVLVGGYVLLFRRFGRDRRYPGSADRPGVRPATGDRRGRGRRRSPGRGDRAVLRAHGDTGRVRAARRAASRARSGPSSTSPPTPSTSPRRSSTSACASTSSSRRSRTRGREGGRLEAHEAEGRRRELLPYEKEYPRRLFRNGDEVELSDLRNKFAARMTTIRKALMDDAMAQRLVHPPARSARARSWGVSASSSSSSASG